MATVTAPPLRPPSYSLIIASGGDVSATRDLAGVRWDDVYGMKWTPRACTSIGAIGPCDTDTVAEFTLPDDCGDIDEAWFRAIDLWAGYRTTAFGVLDAVQEAQAREALTASESYILAGELWAGTQAIANSLPNAYLAQAGATVVDTGVQLSEAVGKLEDARGDCILGARGMLHVSPLLLDLLVTRTAVRREGNLWVTPMGHVVVADDGYPGTAPAGSADTPDTEWAFATGIVDVRLGQVSDPFVGPGTFDRRTNTHEVRVRRAGAAIFDPCCRLALEVDVSAVGLGEDDDTVSVAATSGTTTNTTDTAVGAAAVVLLAANTARKHALIQNTGTANMRVRYDGGVPDADHGVQLEPGGTLELSQPYISTAAVQAIREGATSTTASVEQTV